MKDTKKTVKAFDHLWKKVDKTNLNAIVALKNLAIAFKHYELASEVRDVERRLTLLKPIS